MNNLKVGIKKRYFAMLLLLVIALFIAVFMPMRRAMQRQTIENYNLLTASKLQTVTGLVDASVSSVRSLASRTAIRDYIVDYKNGKMTWEELEQRTLDNYLEGVAAIDNVEFAMRQAISRPLVLYNLTDFDAVNYMNMFSYPQETEFRFQTYEGQTRLVTCAPIIYEGENIGIDIIVVNVTKQLEELRQDGFQIDMLSWSNEILLQVQSGRTKVNLMLDGVAYVCEIQPLSSRYLLMVSKQASEVFAGVNRISLFTIGGFVAGLGVIFIILHFTLVRIANSIIGEVKGSRDIYKKHAHHDALTGVYTRSYFKGWMEEHDAVFRENKYVIGMIDINRFKWINDTYGHKTGDAVLKFIADTLLHELRDNDFIFRFGGDEFVAIFENISLDVAAKIFDRVQHALHQNNTFPFAITVSYGVEAVETLDNIYQSIEDTLEKADRRMYQQKNSGTAPLQDANR